MTPEAEPGALKGSMLGGYRLVDLLGAGGMAEVYRGVAPRDGQEVAVKVLPAHLATDPGYVKRFREEARRVAALSHPNVVPVFNFGDERGLLYIIMPVLKESLRDRMDRDGKIDPGQAARLTVQIASALDAAHNQGLVHRDVKPENILLNAEGRAMLTDFGIARELDVLRDGSAARTLAATGLPVGTPEYMAPEQLRGGAVDQRVDIYALGAVLYELVTGHVPHDAETPYEVAALVLTERALPPSEYNPAVWRELEDVILGALATDPADRYATMRAFAGALRRAVLERAPGAGEEQAVALVAEPTPLARTLATRRLGDSRLPTAGLALGTIASRSGALPWVESAPTQTPPKLARRRRPVVLALVAIVLTLGLVTGSAVALLHTAGLPWWASFGTFSVLPPTSTPDTSGITGADGTPGADATPSVVGNATLTATALTPSPQPGATSTPQPTATPSPVPSITLNPGPLQLQCTGPCTARKLIQSHCVGSQVITNNSSVSVQWSWSTVTPSSAPTLTYSVDTVNNSSSTQPSGTVAPGAYSTVYIQTQYADTPNCSTYSVNVTITVVGGKSQSFQMIY